ncbi:MAG: hypothetical protein OHK0019_15630 [Saprospiraceae bacterium]
MQKALFLFLFFASKVSFAQPYFSKNYHVSYNDAGWNILVLEDGLLMLSSSICEGGVSCTGFVKTDFDGNTDWILLIDSLRVSNQNNILFDSSNIYLTMYKGGGWEVQNIRLLNLDHNGNFVNYERIGDGLEYELPFL